MSLRAVRLGRPLGLLGLFSPASVVPLLFLVAWWEAVLVALGSCVSLLYLTVQVEKLDERRTERLRKRYVAKLGLEGAARLEQAVAAYQAALAHGQEREAASATEASRDLEARLAQRRAEIAASTDFGETSAELEAYLSVAPVRPLALPFTLLALAPLAFIPLRRTGRSHEVAWTLGLTFVLLLNFVAALRRNRARTGGLRYRYRAVLPLEQRAALEAEVASYPDLYAARRAVTAAKAQKRLAEQTGERGSHQERVLTPQEQGLRRVVIFLLVLGALLAFNALDNRYHWSESDCEHAYRTQYVDRGTIDDEGKDAYCRNYKQLQDLPR